MDSPSNAGDTDQTPPPASTGRWLRIALAVSLAINLGIVGMLAGAMFRHGGPPNGATMARDVGFGPFTEALSKEDRLELRRAFLAAAPELRDSRKAVRADFAELLAQLRASQFDADALRAVFDRQSARNAERMELGQRLILDLVVGMKPEARAAFADRLERSLAKGPKRRDTPSGP
jgi:uncharacterized membrane protein